MSENGVVTIQSRRSVKATIDSLEASLKGLPKISSSVGRSAILAEAPPAA